MISRGVKNGIIFLSGLQLILGLLLLIMNRVWLHEMLDIYKLFESDVIQKRTWWTYGIPYVIIAAVGFVAPKRQTFMGAYMVLNIVGLVLAACWWAEMIHVITFTAKSCDNEVDIYTHKSCLTFHYYLALTILTGFSALMCVFGIIVTARNISDDNSVQNVGYGYGRLENPTILQTVPYYATQPGVHYAQAQPGLPAQYVPVAGPGINSEQKTVM